MFSRGSALSRDAEHYRDPSCLLESQLARDIDRAQIEALGLRPPTNGEGRRNWTSLSEAVAARHSALRRRGHQQNCACRECRVIRKALSDAGLWRLLYGE